MRAAFLYLLVCTFCTLALADEGMWLFDRVPKDVVKQKYDFDVSGQFLENLRLSSVQIGGETGALVSPHGLLLTNQHIVASCLAKLSVGHGNALLDGFYAALRAEEPQCPGFSANVLTNIEDVTAQVVGPTKKAGASTQRLEQRNVAIEQIRKNCATKTGDICEVVNLYSGNRFSLYRYKHYSDVRLVFAPEQALAFFGRERDAITYLRYGLDIAFVRLYEDGNPASTTHYVKWSEAPLKEGDLVFSSGRPAATMRETTAAQLTFYRDTQLPLVLTRLGARIKAVNGFAAQSERNREASQATLTDLLTSYKAAAGKLIGLRDDRLVLRKTAFDQKIRNAVERDPQLGANAAKVWDQVAAAYKSWAPFEKAYETLEANPAPGSVLFRLARQVVRGQALDTNVSVNEALEIVLLTQYLEELRALPSKEAPGKEILKGRSAQAAAEAFVKSSKLGDIAERRRLAANRNAAANSDDGIIQLANLLEPAAERIRKKHDEVIGTLETTASDRIAQYRYQLFGDAEYPDATGTPRVEFGILKSYVDRAGVSQPSVATFGGLFYRQANGIPYQLPRRWMDAKPALNLEAPLDFVSTCDIGGGNFGSLTVNRAGELVGIVFDGNLESLSNTYLYIDEQARAVHVSTAGIAEALGKVYRAASLLQEIGVAPARGDL